MRSHALLVVSDREDVAIEIRDPLLSLDRIVQISQRIPNVRLDGVPEEGRIALNQVSGGLIAKLVETADLHEFIVESIELAQIKRIAKLADQVRSAKKACFAVCPGVISILRDRKPRHLDRARNTFTIYLRHLFEPLSYANLGTIHMVWSQE